MKKKIFFISSFFLILPLFVSAQMIDMNQIIPSNILKPDINSQPLSKLLNQLFYIGLVAAVVLALIMIIRGGVEYMTIDAITSKERGKQRVKAALGGLVLSFSAILILNTINPSLTSLNFVFQELNKIGEVVVSGAVVNIGTERKPMAVKGWFQDENGNYIQEQSDGSIFVSTPDGKSFTKYPDGTVKPGFIRPDGSQTQLLGGQTEDAVRSYFEQNGIRINAQQGTTNVAGLGQGAMIGVVNIKNQSGAEIVITGGTEPGHKTHGIGKSIVDLRKNSTLDSYIKNNAVRNYKRGSWTEYELPGGATYMDEGDHWHVEY
jgi:uncharacterized membrane protein YciS (DUF1049 family)